MSTNEPNSKNKYFLCVIVKAAESFLHLGHITMLTEMTEPTVTIDLRWVLTPVVTVALAIMVSLPVGENH